MDCAIQEVKIFDQWQQTDQYSKKNDKGRPCALVLHEFWIDSGIYG